ncbi:hypothetical protein INT47_007074 [Mucor saturninus]|uniref:Uncharacterized protein n=1 Tax=Mucor saturninus TaxID=64648 RepID=A0A8H7V1U7_9FUNG|nr:hypothetical protein INT47_007074 [Mucor saturninus]
MSEDNQQPSLQEQFAQMQRQIQQQQETILLMQQQQQQQQQQHEDFSHSNPTRPKFDWNPSANLVHLMHLDQDLFVEAPLFDRERLHQGNEKIQSGNLEEMETSRVVGVPKTRLRRGVRRLQELNAQ